MNLGDVRVDYERYRRIEDLFHTAADKPPSARSAFVTEACRDDPELGSEVIALLAADDSRAIVLDTPACDALLDSNPVRSLDTGQRVGSYEIVRLVGSGGMGNVYEAIQDSPRRSVALKILRTALASDADRRRFAGEAELLGRLRHPNIASIHDAGLHTDGPLSVPYFAMEYIANSRTLVEYARNSDLPVSSRLEMFVQVCEAVQHGHQKGIVHRDLKPGNILVDVSGVPKIIDYGVACSVDHDKCMTTVRTSADAFLGTLQYMSPEQLGTDQGDVDTRSDVYALGLILFELLAERRPYDFSTATLSAAIEAIEHRPCPTLGSVCREYRGDLSTIAAKAMEKARAHRYQSPGELAADIQRFQSHEPILARPPRVSYRLAKFAARHKPLAASLVLVVAAVVSGLGVAAWQFRNATTERDRARIEARKAERISEFLRDILASADPRTSTTAVTIRDALERAAGTVDSVLLDEPEVYAEVQSMIGSIFERLGDHTGAERHLRAALETRRTLYGNESCDVAMTLSDLSWSVGYKDTLEQERLLREALHIYRKSYGDDHPVTAVHKSYIAACLSGRGDYVESEALVSEAIAILKLTRDTEDDDLAFACKVYASCLEGQGRMAEAETAFRAALDLHRRVYPTDHYELGLMLGSMASFLLKVNKPDEAAALREESACIMEMRVGHAPLCK